MVLKFSTQNLLSIREGQREADVYANALEECRLADALGFHTVWLAEHHFSSYGICPSLAVLAAAIARETRRVRIGSAVVIAPFAHPLRIAEEWAMVDILCGGRLEFGLGRGYQPREFTGLDVSMERTRERFDEAFEIIRRAWAGQRVTFSGEFYRVPGVGIHPRPVQQPHPPLWTAAVSPDTFELAGRRGLKILTSPAFTPFDVLRKNYETYRAAYRTAHGTDDGAEICLNKIVHVADSPGAAREDLREPIRWFFRTQADLIADATGVPADQYRFYQRVRENLLSLSEETALEQAAIVGDADEVADKIHAHVEALGVTHFMCAFSRGGLAHDKALHSMRLFAEKVMPRVSGVPS
jgi:natural product biosynthesis luciferase-like monooxygenase protein